MFDVKNVQYPARFANFQHNSYVPLEPLAPGRVVWSKDWYDINPRLQIIPFDLLLNGRYLGVRAGTVLLMLDDNGEFLFSTALGENTPVVFGGGAVAYLKQGYLLEYIDYNGKLQLEMREFPAMGDFTRLIFLRPGEDDFLAATHFTGGPQRETPHFDVYRIMMDKTDRLWSYGGDGGIDEALLTSDEKILVMIRDNLVTLFNAEDGKILGEFETGYTDFMSASLDQENNLVQIGRDGKGSCLVRKTGLTGKDDWSYALIDPKQFQPPACAPGDRVYVADGYKVVCLETGKLLWEKALPGGHPLMTIGAGNTAVILDSGTLVTFDAEGEMIARLVLSDSPETFEAPPVIGADGRIYVAGAAKLYCVE